MFKKFVLFTVLGFSCHSLLPIKIQTGSYDKSNSFVADGGEFELTDGQRHQLQSTLINGIFEEPEMLSSWEAIPLPINQQTLALLVRMLDDESVFNVERAGNILRDSSTAEFLPLFHALCYLDTTNTELYRVVAQRYLAIQQHISFDDFAQHAQYIIMFFQQDCVKELLANATAPYTYLQTCTVHTDGVGSVAFSPDGQTLATGSSDQTVKLCRLTDGQCLQTFTGHTGWVWSVAFSPDGTKLATGSWNNTAKVLDVNTGNCLQTFTGHAGWIGSVAFSPDGTKLATGSFDNTAKVWDVNTGNCLQTFTGHTDDINSVAFSPDGQTLATGSNDDTAKVWDVNTGTCLHTFTGHTGWVRSVAFSPDGTKLATGS